MLRRMYLIPDDMWARVENGELLYTPINVVSDDTHTHIYLAGQLPRLPGGEVPGKTMREQIRQACENIEIGLGHVGATFDDIVTTTTYVLDLKEYYAASDERFKFFKINRPASTLIQVAALGMPDAKVEITVEAIIETERLRLGNFKNGLIRTVEDPSKVESEWVRVSAQPPS
ncbi:MAG: RidA family protein [Albidovulum sp.]|nr:RidA family protein [Albidovulum sp.]